MHCHFTGPVERFFLRPVFHQLVGVNTGTFCPPCDVRKAAASGLQPDDQAVELEKQSS
jgi:hypothetical protein